MKCGCGGDLTVFHTEQVGVRTVRRRRKCSGCGSTVTTYERPESDVNTAREQGIVDMYRTLSPQQRRAFWAVLNEFGGNDVERG